MTAVAGQLREAPAVAAIVAVLAGDGAVQTRILGCLHGLGARVVTAAPDGDSGDATLLVAQCDRLSLAETAWLRDLRRRSPDARVVIVCERAGLRRIRRAIGAGADGLVLADRLETSLAPTVAAVLAGQIAVPAESGAPLHRQPLSFREKEIRGLAAAGYTNAQISAEIFLAESTVKSHLTSAFTKLGVASRSEAAALYLDPREAIGLGVTAAGERRPRPGGR